MQEKTKIWKVRTVKNYPEAHNHIFIGEVVNMNQSYVRLNCRTFHFGKNINNIKDIRIGGQSVRILPWNRIEIINELPSSFDYSEAELIYNNDGKIALSDEQTECVISSSYDNRY